MPEGSLPILVGIGQVMSRWDAMSGPEGAPNPKQLCLEAARRALADATVKADAIEALAVTRIFEDSFPGGAHPHGHNTNLPGTIARDLGASPAKAIYASVGGQSPQQLASEMAGRIFTGELECALITGSEANKASKAARKHGVRLDWTDEAPLPFEDRGLGDRLLSRTEIRHGLVAPAYLYALFENAMAARDGQTRTQRRQIMSDLFARFATVAHHNPYAQFETGQFDADFLATPSPANYPYADPFLKWHMAQDAVNQGAALLMMSEAKADALKILPEKRVYLHGAGEAGDDFISERPCLTGSWAMQTALDRALQQAGKSPEDIDLFDLYSCFPCAVFSALQALKMDHASEPRPLTVTGGLPFFGGPGNNYTMHALVSMAEQLRMRPASFGLVLANGGWMTKEAVGIWSCRKPDTFHPVQTLAKPTEKTALEPAPTHGIIETYTVTHGKSGPSGGIIFALTPEGKRFIAMAAPEAMPRLLEDVSPAGLAVSVTAENDRNIFRFV